VTICFDKLTAISVQLQSDEISDNEVIAIAVSTSIVGIIISKQTLLYIFYNCIFFSHSSCLGCDYADKTPQKEVSL